MSWKWTTQGQAVTEFALVMPVMLLLVLAVGDFGRIFTSLVAVEAATREAADFGAFEPGNWNSDHSPTDPAQAVVRMQQLACTSAASSHLEGYAEPPGVTWQPKAPFERSSFDARNTFVPARPA